MYSGQRRFQQGNRKYSVSDLSWSKGLSFEEIVFEKLSGIPEVSITWDTRVYSPLLKEDTQIDLVCLTANTLYVLELKSVEKSIIEPIENDSNWTISSKRYSREIISPLIQNITHLHALISHYRNIGAKKLLELKRVMLVVVPDSCEIKVYNSEYVVPLSQLYQRILRDIAGQGGV